MEHWYVVHTHANAEALAAAHLARQGFGTYLPRYARERRHARRVERVRAPLFPRYLFVRLDTERKWLSVRSTTGVSSLLSAGGNPLPLSDAAIAAIRAREDESGLVVLAAAGWAPGTPLRIVDGPLAERLGLFQGLDDRDRVVLLLDFLGRPMRVAVAAGAVRADS